MTSLSPSSGPAGGGTEVYINGTGFTASTTVKFGSASAVSGSGTVDYFNSTELAVLSPPGSGTVDVTVTTSNGTSATSSADRFVYTTSPPTVAGLSQSSGPAGGGTPVYIYGTGFSTGTTVKFGSTPAVSGSGTVDVLGSTQLEVLSPPGTGTVGVTVTNANGTSATSTTDQFTYTTALPVMLSMSPESGSAGGGTEVFLYVEGVTAGMTVQFGSATAVSGSGAVDHLGGGELEVLSPPGTGTVQVTVTNSNGKSSDSEPFTYTAATSVPTVTGISPRSGSTAGGTRVTITGTDFTPLSTVYFGTTVASSVYQSSPTSLTATSPVDTVGTVDVRVVTAGATSATSAADLFTYTHVTYVPTVTGVSLSSGPASGGTSVDIYGTGFTLGDTVRFGSSPAVFGPSGTIYYENSRWLTVTSPPGSGTVDVTVTNSNGTSATSSADQYTYVPVPTVTRISPTSGSRAGGTSVTITGNNLRDATALDFGLNPSPQFTVDSSTQITAISPESRVGTVDVTVTTVGGTSATSSADKFTYVPASGTTLYVSKSGSDTTGDGSSASPYATIGAALTAAPVGGTVLVEPGTYKLSAPLTVTQQVYLESDSSDGATGTNTVIDASGQENGIAITGAGAAGTVVKGLTVENSLKAGIVVEATSNVTIENDIVQGADQSYAASNPTVPATQFTATDKNPCSPGNDCEAVHLIGVTDSTVTGNTVRSNLDGGIYLTDESGPSTGNTISDNQSLNNAVDCGITLASHVPGHGVSNNTVTGNISEGNGAAGIVLATPTGEVSNNTVTGNTVENNAAGGIVLHTHSAIATVSGNVIENNTISGNGPDPGPYTYKPAGIVLYGGGGPMAPAGSTLTNTTITGNMISVEYFGIFLENARPNTINGNTITVSSGGTAVFLAPYALTLNAPAAAHVGNTVTVSGVVYAGDGTPLSGVGVGIVANLPKALVPLALTTTGGDGSYTTTFTAPNPPGALELLALPVVGNTAAYTSVLVLPANVGLTGHQSVTITSAPTNAKPVTVSVPASGGKTATSASVVGLTGTVNVADYDGNPASSAGGVTFNSGSASYFDVSLVATGTTPASATLTVSQCAGVANGEDLYWLNGSNWTPVSPKATYDSSTGCLTAVLSGTSSPTLSQLTGTAFAAATPATTGGGGGGGGGGGAPAAPVVTGLSPTSGPVAGGTVVTITGSGFTGVMAVDFGSNAATDVRAPSGTEVLATAPAGTGTVDVTVQTPSGTSAADSADRFTYAAAAVPKPKPRAVKFSDVPQTYWAYGDIEQLATQGIISGFPDGTFQPNGDVTRAQFVKMLVLALGMAPGKGTTAFTDVPAGAWYAPYVSAALQAGIVDGVSPTMFDPSGTLTREQMALLVARALKLTKTAKLHFSDDARIAAWALQGVREAVAAGYINGFPDGNFQPLGTATRAQAAKVLAMALRNRAS